MKPLTHKTKVAFEKWYFQTHCKCSIKFEDLLTWQKAEIFDWLYSQSETIQHAFFIEFFDSVGIYIDIIRSIIPTESPFTYHINGKRLANFWRHTRPEATSKALEKANDFFNNR